MNRPTLFNQDVTTSWAALPDLEGTMVSLLNNSGVGVSVRRKGVEAVTNVFFLKDGQAWSFRHLTNANQLEILGESETGTVYGEVEPT